MHLPGTWEREAGRENLMAEVGRGEVSRRRSRSRKGREERGKGGRCDDVAISYERRELPELCATSTAFSLWVVVSTRGVRWLSAEESVVAWRGGRGSVLAPHSFSQSVWPNSLCQCPARTAARYHDDLLRELIANRCTRKSGSSFTLGPCRLHTRATPDVPKASSNKNPRFAVYHALSILCPFPFFDEPILVLVS